MQQSHFRIHTEQSKIFRYLVISVFCTFDKMGNWFSSPNSETKAIESDGAVNNNVVIQGEVMDYSFEIMVLTAVICALKVFELVIYIYKKHKKLVRENFKNEIKLGNEKV